MADIDPDVLAEIQRYEAEEDYGNPRYLDLLMEHRADFPGTDPPV